MFAGYIRAKNEKNECRGGIGSAYTNAELNDYAIEVGSRCNCEAEHAVVASHAYAIIDFLKTTPSPMAKVLLHSIQNGITEFRRQLDESNERELKQKDLLKRAKKAARRS